jgi:hypothetical protein
VTEIPPPDPGAAGPGSESPTAYGTPEPLTMPPAGPPAPVSGGYPVWPANVPTMLPPLPAPPGAYPVTVTYEPVTGTPYGLLYPRVRPVTSGAAIGSLAAGIASIVVGLSMTCLGLIGSSRGWGAFAAGAFAILAVLFALAAVWVGTLTLRVIRQPAWPFGAGVVGPGMMPVGSTRYGVSGGPLATGTVGFGGASMAVAGRVCGWIGFGLTLVGFLGVLLASAAG